MNNKYKSVNKYKIKYIGSYQKAGSSVKEGVASLEEGVASLEEGVASLEEGVALLEEGEEEWVKVELPDKNYEITEICCSGNITQYPARMSSCEDFKHTIGATASQAVQTLSKSRSLSSLASLASLGSLSSLSSLDSPESQGSPDRSGKGSPKSSPVGKAKASGFLNRVVEITEDKSLDGIVKIQHNSKNRYIVSDTANRIINKINYVSDHDGIINSITFDDNDMFNLISFNLEGLCRQDIVDMGEFSEFSRRLELLEIHLSDFKRPGNIIVCQEVVLQRFAEELNQQRFLRDSMRLIEDKFNKLFYPIRMVNDNDMYTGGIFYDKDFWYLKETIVINRYGSNKKSNAYLFKKKLNNQYQIWIVNIHLKAGAKSEEHIKELSNILKQLNRRNNDFEVPVYLCGDYNNDASKVELVKIAELQ